MWSDNEVLQLINLWGEEGMQEQLEEAKRNKHVYEKILKALGKIGIHKSGDQCRTKMKKLKMDYCKVMARQGKEQPFGNISRHWMLFWDTVQQPRLPYSLTLLLNSLLFHQLLMMKVKFRKL